MTDKLRASAADALADVVRDGMTVAVGGFGEIAAALEAVEPEPLARMRAYLDFAVGQPHVYEAMFSMPSGLPFGAGRGPEPLRRAFAAVQEAFPGPDVVRAEVAWACLHGLATLQISGRLPEARAQARLEQAHQMLAECPQLHLP